MTRAYLATSSRCAGDCACRFFDGLRPAYIILLSLLPPQAAYVPPLPCMAKSRSDKNPDLLFYVFNAFAV